MVLLFAVVSSEHFLCGQLVEHDIYKEDEEDVFCLKMVIDFLTHQIKIKI